jgi:polyisoprenoid-binding protein YceI
MKNRFLNFAIAISICGLFAFTFVNINWNIDPNYSIKFSGSQAAGTFTGLRGKTMFNPNNLAASSIDVTVDARTIKTGNATKDDHARGKDWFDVATYPNIRFTSSSFGKSGNFWVVTGILELRGVKKQVQIPFTFSESANKGRFVGSFKVKRKDYGIFGNFFGFTVGSEFDIQLNIPVSR